MFSSAGKYTRDIVGTCEVHNLANETLVRMCKQNSHKSDLCLGWLCYPWYPEQKRGEGRNVVYASVAQPLVKLDT